MITEYLRKIRFKQHLPNAEWQDGYFHKWFDKIYDDGESQQMFVVELKTGKVILDSLSHCTLEFVDEPPLFPANAQSYLGPKENGLEDIK